MHFSPVFAIAALIASASALTAGHHARGHNHRAIAARVAQPAGVTDKVTPTVRKRGSNKRCKNRKSSSASLVGNTTTTKVKATPTPKEDVEPTIETPESEITTSKTIKQALATPKPDPTTTIKAAATIKSSSGSNSGLSFMVGVQTGEGTYYDTGLGACGIYNKDTDYIAAMSQLLFDAYPGYNGVNPNKNPLCNKKVKATYKGKSVTVTITDRCVGCKQTDLDFSPTAFSQLADFGVGRLEGMTWEWV